ncbi:MAG: signal peptide peptidase SppA [Bacteroidia bacterium]|nr:signal peptide peptidase SppA [Bacteroidia bacterium]
MKDFLKFTLASIIGCLVVLLVLFFMTAGIIASLSKEKTVQVASQSILEIKLNYPVSDRTPMAPVPFFSGDLIMPVGLNDILKNIEKAEKDTRISGIFLNISMLQAGMATTTEIRNALEKFKKSGKFIYAYSERYTQKAYYLASVADKIFLNPMGSLEFKGLNAQVMFYKNLLEKVEVEVQIIRPEGNKYKSAVEPFFLDQMSPASREQTEKYITAIWGSMLEEISLARQLTTDELNKMADELTGLDAERALQANLVDELYYIDQVYDALDEATGKTPDGKITSILLAKYRKTTIADKKPYTADKIAVIYASGNIVDGKADETTVGSADFIKAIRKARMDDQIKAVVLRVNSPGGSVVASDVILREMRLLKNAKPVIASYGDVAASGGYYISCFADTIVAMPNSITGSIGIFGLFPNMKGLLNNKTGITTDQVSTNTNSGFPDVFNPLNDFEMHELQRNVTDGYHNFTALVAEGRGMQQEEVDRIGQGRVWAGKDAITLGLVDVFGGLNEAIRIAALAANLENYKIRELPDLKDPFEQVMDMISGNPSEELLQNVLGMHYSWFSILKNIETLEGIQARMPYEIIIH